MTNDKRGGELSIQKCDWCKDGYLIVKGGRSGPILGCTNYKSDKSGCGRLLSLEHYRVWRKDDFGMEDPSKDRPAYFCIPESSAGNSQAPEMIPAKANPVMKKKAEIYTIGYSERRIQSACRCEWRHTYRHATSRQVANSKTNNRTRERSGSVSHHVRFSIGIIGDRQTVDPRRVYRHKRNHYQYIYAIR